MKLSPIIVEIDASLRLNLVLLLEGGQGRREADLLRVPHDQLELLPGGSSRSRAIFDRRKHWKNK